MTLQQQLGAAIRELRGDLSQEEFAAHCGLMRTQVGPLEAGEMNPTVKTLVRIARGMKKTIQITFKPA